ncbi:dihydroorotase [Flavobacteriaceae bacterium]|nr:dihydroorotase [Flavobacteriaceae bacterium]MDB4306623.1 dihydroorotase [Flavobacteriaceae bacterium]
MKTSSKLLLQNGIIVNEGKARQGDILIENNRIVKIASAIPVNRADEVYNAAGKHILPGCIDDQVHFREPGLTHKASIASESRAALAGGITSFLEMPNTQPQTTTVELWEAKNQIAAATSAANYGFMFGGTNDNLDEILALDSKRVPALKLFLGSSTGNMLVDNPAVLRKIFSSTKLVIAVHCEDELTIKENLAAAKATYGEVIPPDQHPIIRSETACYLSSSKAVALAKETGARLHVFHLSTAKELKLFSNKIPLADKKITAEVCVHHLNFSDKDYASKGNRIKWNPAVKTEADQNALWEAFNNDLIDVLATDHAPHTMEEKEQPYLQAPSGGPLVQHALPAMLTAVNQGKTTLEKLVEKAAHNPAILFDIKDRGFIREGYYADLVVVDMQQPTTVSTNDLLYKCGWSPFEGTTFSAAIERTLLNGHWVYCDGEVIDVSVAMPLEFDRN